MMKVLLPKTKSSFQSPAAGATPAAFRPMALPCAGAATGTIGTELQTRLSFQRGRPFQRSVPGARTPAPSGWTVLPGSRNKYGIGRFYRFIPHFIPYWIDSSRLLNKGVHARNRRFKLLEPGSCWRKLCQSHGTFSPFGFADRPAWGHRAKLAHCQVMLCGLPELPPSAPAAWPSEPGCRPWPPSAPPDQSGPTPDTGSAGTRPPSSSSQRSPPPVSESAG